VLARVRPTVFGSVPRVWEKMRAALEAAAGVGVADAARADPAVAAAIRARIGLDQVQWLGCGAAPPPGRLRAVLHALRLPVCEVWGMSERSCIVTTNRPGATRFGSVGLPLDGMEVRVAEDGELLVRGPLVMAGYRGRDDLTVEAIDAEGWLHTGDVA